MSKWNRWYESQNETTKAWLDNQKNIWDGKDLAFVGVIGFVCGLFFGLCLGTGF